MDGIACWKESISYCKKINNDDVICEEYKEADGKAYKIKFIDIITIDGQEPNELAAVYGLGPKTERFKRRKIIK